MERFHKNRYHEEKENHSIETKTKCLYGFAYNINASRCT